VLGIAALLAVSAPLAALPQDCAAEVDTLALGAPWSTYMDDGGSVALDGDHAAVGRHWTTAGGGAPYAGSVRLLRRGADGWVLDALLEAPSPCSGESFGFSVDLEGELLVVGTGQGVSVAGGGPPCPLKGRVYVYDLAGGAPVHVQTLSGGPNAHAFGHALELDRKSVV
jgi:hypothetical protein